MTLTKAELADLLFEKVGLNKREAKDMVEAFVEEIRGALARGASRRRPGFGIVERRPNPHRPGQHPTHGQEGTRGARRVVIFHGSRKLKAMVENARQGARPQHRWEPAEPRQALLHHRSSE